jgi:copper homeostasis protein
MHDRGCRGAERSRRRGVVTGCLLQDRRIDKVPMSRLVEAARPMSIACHRSFDMTRDAEEAIEALARLGIHQVLTSGQHDSAVDGIETLARVLKAARSRLKIMARRGLNVANIAEVLHRSGADELHLAAPKTLASGITFRNPEVGMAGTAPEREFELVVTDPTAVRLMIAAARAAELS